MSHAFDDNNGRTAPIVQPIRSGQLRQLWQVLAQDGVNLLVSGRVVRRVRASPGFEQRLDDLQMIAARLVDGRQIAVPRGSAVKDSPIKPDQNSGIRLHPMLPTIHETYRDYQPPRWVRPTIERLMRVTPAEYFSNLGSIVLTNAAAVGPGKTRRVRGRKFNRDACRGFYHRKHGRTPAFIEIVVDNSIAGTPAYVFLVNLTRDMLLGHVLFHEVGHHLDVTIGAAARTGEAAAEDWGRRLFHLYYKRHYWWLLPFGRVIRFIGRWGSRRLKSSSRTG